ncbi:hypothetical protein [Microvirga massiliensis]|uniref:hypothetical protein n=1 Tax=Microvirga massiliensis TaxID=1033741 RepID=UPI00065FD1CE|nr:hypothetical protein [Microvirga massiliensis]
MANNIVSLLRGAPAVRQLTEYDHLQAVSFFRSRMGSLLNTEVRRHPLGFLYASEVVSNGMSLRYHLWPEGWHVPATQTASEIHDHVYELNSLVLRGALRHETFEAVAAQDGDHELLEVAYSAEESSVLRTGARVVLRPLADEIHGVGTAYRLPPGVIHRASALAAPAATLVLTVAQPAAPAPRVFIPVGHEAPQPFARRQLTDGETAEARRLLENL